MKILRNIIYIATFFLTMNICFAQTSVFDDMRSSIKARQAAKAKVCETNSSASLDTYCETNTDGIDDILLKGINRIEGKINSNTQRIIRLEQVTVTPRTNRPTFRQRSRTTSTPSRYKRETRQEKTNRLGNQYDYQGGKQP